MGRECNGGSGTGTFSAVVKEFLSCVSLML